MTLRLADKVAVVTGSTRGIGRATALRFAAEGAAVVVTGRTVSDGEAVITEIERGGGTASFVPADLELEDDVHRVVDHAVDRFGRVDILVNNGATTDLVGPGGTDGTVDALDTARWESIQRGCTTTVLWSCQAALRHMVAGNGGAIVSISSAAAARGTASMAGYQVAKAGLEALTRSIAVDYAEHGVRSNTIVVGFVVSRPTHEAMVADPVAGPAIRALHLTRLGRPDDVAAAALFLVSDEAGFITGTTLVVDGGSTSRMPVPDLAAARRRAADAVNNPV